MSDTARHTTVTRRNSASEPSRVDEGNCTCKKSHPSLARRPASPAVARRRGASGVPPRLDGRGNDKRGEVVVLTSVATGRSAGVGAEWWCGLPARRKKRKAACHRGSRGSRGSSRSRRVRLLPRASPVFAAIGVPTGGSNFSLSPLHFSFSSGGLVEDRGAISPLRWLGLGVLLGARRWLK
jgi:hypothetical protein